MTFRRGEYVEVSGRAGRVRGFESVEVFGSRLDMLTIVLTATRNAIVRVPVDQVASRVRRISKSEAASLNGNIPEALSLMVKHARELRAAKAARFLDVRSLGGKAKAAKHKREAAA